MKARAVRCVKRGTLARIRDFLIDKWRKGKQILEQFKKSRL